jgi:hypothetical protein
MYWILGPRDRLREATSTCVSSSARLPAEIFRYLTYAFLERWR